MAWIAGVRCMASSTTSSRVPLAEPRTSTSRPRRRPERPPRCSRSTPSASCAWPTRTPGTSVIACHITPRHPSLGQAFNPSLKRPSIQPSMRARVVAQFEKTGSRAPVRLPRSVVWRGRFPPLTPTPLPPGRGGNSPARVPSPRRGGGLGRGGPVREGNLKLGHYPRQALLTSVTSSCRRHKNVRLRQCKPTTAHQRQGSPKTQHSHVLRFAICSMSPPYFGESTSPIARPPLSPCKRTIAMRFDRSADASTPTLR